MSVPGNDALAAAAAAGYWNEDTAYVCYTRAHAWLAGLGALWMAGFCIGFPLAMALALWPVRARLEEKDVSARARARARCPLRAPPPLARACRKTGRRAANQSAKLDTAHTAPLL